MHRDIVPNPRRCAKFDGAKGAWAVRSKNAAGSGERFDNLLFIDDGENTKVYDIAAPEGDDNGYTERNAPEFEGEGATVDVGTLSDGAHIVHCRRSDVRIYDANLGLDQIIPMVDEETDAEFNIVHVSISDPYVLVIRDDSSVVVLTVQGKEIEPIEGAGIISEKKWLSGSIYAGDLTSNSPALFLLSADSGMHIFSLPDLELRLAIPTLSHLPPVLSADAAQRRAGAKETLTELLVCDLGQRGVTSPFLVMRTAIDDVVLYEPFRYPRPGARDNWYMNLRFRKVPLSYIPRYNESVLEAGSNARQPPLKSMRIGEYSAISIPGALACVLLKESSTVPKVLEVRGAQASSQVTTLSPIHRAGLEHGFMHINDQEELQESQLPPDTWFGLGWSISQTSLGGQGNDVRHLAFHEPRGLYVVASCRNVDFYFAEEDGRHPEQDSKSNSPCSIRHPNKHHALVLLSMRCSVYKRVPEKSSHPGHAVLTLA
jgi:cleavage and polyadenylation specificity factor subunit 1